MKNSSDRDTAQVSTKQDILQYLLKQGHATAHELAQNFEISPQAVRRHLKDLETEGLIFHQTKNGQEMGRPQHIYRLSPEGRDRFPDSYDQFAINLLNTLTETVGVEQVAEILQKQWQRKALEYRQQVGNGSLKERIANLAKIRRTEGYVAECYEVEDSPQSGGTHPARNRPNYIFTEYNCAISHIVKIFPNICGHELEMFASALDHCKVERTHWMVDGEHCCGYLIQDISQ
jgi:DeoR family transcriptional regulator, suf operon transcriptional repressor